jgi:hypothetical protein
MGRRPLQISRRDFVRAASAVVGLSPLAESATRLRVPTAGIQRVALVHTTDRRDGVTRALRLLALRPMVGQRVVLKPNFNSADPSPASTHTDTLTQLVTELH